jgi:hypothetical protein
VSAAAAKRWRAGGCHCGTVRFDALLADAEVAHDCNCSMCGMVGFEHLIVPDSGFRIVAGADRLTEYRFNTGVARHLFCSVCGVKAFYRPRSNPDGWSVNARCLDVDARPVITHETFDGRNWEANAAALAHLSQD